MAVIAGVTELLRRLAGRGRAAQPPPAADTRATAPEPRSEQPTRPVHAEQARPERIRPVRPGTPPPAQHQPDPEPGTAEPDRERPRPPSPRKPGDVDNCADCARLWAASGYDPTVRCRKHRRR
jgi:hypothetical protein